MPTRSGRKVRNWSESPFSDRISESWLKNESRHLVRKSSTDEMRVYQDLPCLRPRNCLYNLNTGTPKRSSEFSYRFKLHGE
jgi:hypothetical protein